MKGVERKRKEKKKQLEKLTCSFFLSLKKNKLFTPPHTQPPAGVPAPPRRLRRHHPRDGRRVRRLQRADGGQPGRRRGADHRDEPARLAVVGGELKFFNLSFEIVLLVPFLALFLHRFPRFFRLRGERSRGSSLFPRQSLSRPSSSSSIHLIKNAKKTSKKNFQLQNSSRPRPPASRSPRSQPSSPSASRSTRSRTTSPSRPRPPSSPRSTTWSPRSRASPSRSSRAPRPS